MRMRSCTMCVGLVVTGWLADRAGGRLVVAADSQTTVDFGERDRTDRYLGHFSALLRDGFASKPSRLKVAEGHYQAARRVRPDDPRLEYAYGLVLMKNLKHSAAIAQFRAAAQGDVPYLPAARAGIRETIRRKKYATALKELVALAEIVGAAQGPQPSPADRIETARWMGLAVGFMTGSQVSESIRERAAAADAVIQQRLREDCQDHYELGKKDVLIIESQLLVEQQTAESSAKLKQQAKQTSAAARRQDYQARREEFLGTKEKWDAWWADTSSELDSRLDQLADAFDALSDSATSLAESIRETELDLRRSQNLANIQGAANAQGAGEASGGNFRVTRGLTRQVIERSREYDQYVTEYWNTLAQRERTARQAQVLLKQRTAAEQRYRRATGAVAKQVERVQQWDARVKRSMEDAAKAPPSSRRAKAVAKRSQSFSTYDTFDLMAEQQRMLHVYDKPMN